MMAQLSNKDFIKTILPMLQEKYTLVLQSTSADGEITLRATISNTEEAESFMIYFSQITKTDWIVKYALKKPERLAYHKQWFCKHSKKNKRGNKKRNADCLAKLGIKIKNITPNTIKKDAFLRGPLKFLSIVKILNVHTHPIDTVDSLRMRRVPNETKQLFAEYFSSGMTAGDARKFHASKILEKYDFESLADAAVNPTTRQINHMYDTWRQNYGSRFDSLENLEELDLYNAEAEFPASSAFATEEQEQEIGNEIERVASLVQGKIPYPVARRFLSCLEKVKNTKQALKLLSLVKQSQRTRKKVQSISIASSVKAPIIHTFNSLQHNN